MKTYASLITIASLLATPAVAHESDGKMHDDASKAQATTSQHDDTMSTKRRTLGADGSWISLSGEVRSVTADSFQLDYGGRTVTVEMDDGDRDADAYQLVEGDKVVVSGMIDKDFFESAKIEAGSVYVDSIDTYFYSSAVDEEDTFVTVATPVVVASTILQGKVTSVDEEEFTLDSGDRRIEVSIEALSENPLDEDGYQRVEVGDTVSVSGSIDDDFLEGREFEAQSVVTLSKGTS